MKNIKGIYIGIGACVLFVLLIVFWYIGTYNGLVKADAEVEEKWANVETAYQRRADLIPNLVNTVEGFKIQEKEVLLGVTEARSRWTSAATVPDKQAAATGLDSAISRLLLVVENYPDLKSNVNFLALQDELAGTENRIKRERDLFNEAVKKFNIKTRTFPSSFVAGRAGYEAVDSFEADEGTDVVPVVDFS